MNNLVSIANEIEALDNATDDYTTNFIVYPPRGAVYQGLSTLEAAQTIIAERSEGKPGWVIVPLWRALSADGRLLRRDELPNDAFVGQSSGHATDSLIWTSDNIDRRGEKTPVRIGLMDGSGRNQFVSLEEALAVAEHIDRRSGYPRLLEVMRAAWPGGNLCPGDLAACRAAGHRIWEILNNSTDDLHVSYYVVVEDRIDNGRRVCGIPVSPKFATEEQCCEAAEAIKATKPDAYLACCRVFFHWADGPDKFAFRAKLLDEIRCGEASHV